MNNLTPLMFAAVVIGGYLLGSIPFGVIVTRLGGAGDIRSVGSGNIGATNVLRTGRRDLTLMTLLGDGGKGAVAVLLARWLAGHAGDGQFAAALAGGAAFVGHIFPVWLKFKGGKGVATFFGVLLAVAWPVGVLAGLTWICMAVLFRMSSLAALTAAAFAPLFAFAVHAGYPVIVLAVGMMALIFLRHRENIVRLANGAEPRIGAKTPAAGKP